MKQLLEYHAGEMHALDKEIEEALFGPFDPTLGENVRDKSKGMQHQLSELYAHTENGGMPSKLTAKDRRLIVTTGTTVIVALLLDIIAHV